MLHVTQASFAGVAAIVGALAESQQQLGWSPVIAAPERDEIPEIAGSAGVRFVEWEARRSPGPSLVTECLRLRGIVRRERPDVVHLHSSKAGLAGRLVVRGAIPTIFHPNAWSFLAMGGVGRRVAEGWERASSRWSDLLISSSDGETAIGRSLGIRTPIVTVGNGVDVERFTPVGGGDRERLRAELGLSRQPIAVCIGRLCDQKGQDLLVAHWPKVSAMVRGAQLVLVGDGPLGSQLREQAPPFVVFAGARRDVERYLGVADVVVQPSRYEGLSLATLEAMACGRSVVAFDVQGMRDTIGDDAGAIVPPGDIDAFCAEVIRRFNEPERALAEGAAGRLRVMEYFTLEQWCGRVNRATLDLLDRNGSQ